MSRPLVLLPAMLACAVLAAPAHAAVGCVFNAGAKTLTITATANHDSALIAHEPPPDNHVLVLSSSGSQFTCAGGSPTDTQINSIAFSDTSSGGSTQLIVSMTTGMIGPGATSEGQFNSSEIEISASMGDGPNDQLWIAGSPLADHIRLGQSAPSTATVNLNTVEFTQDADITATGTEAVYANGVGGADIMGTQGAAGTGAAVTSYFAILYGDVGNDQVTGGEGADYLGGGADDDTITGGEGDDFVGPGAGTDT